MKCSSAVSLVVWVVMAVVAADPAATDVGTQLQEPSRLGEQGAPGGQCPNFVLFTAPDGCSTCLCVVDGRMTFCSRAACPEPGNYTINECVENALYVGSDGCNHCQCNAWRSFSWCTRKICVEAEATTPPSSPPPLPPSPPTYPPNFALRPPFPTQRPPRPPPPFASFRSPLPPRAPVDSPFLPFPAAPPPYGRAPAAAPPILSWVSSWLGLGSIRDAQR